MLSTLHVLSPLILIPGRLLIFLLYRWKTGLGKTVLFAKVYPGRRTKAWIWTLTCFLITGIMLWEVFTCGTPQSLYQMVDLQWRVAHQLRHPVPVGCIQPLALALTQLKSVSLASALPVNCPSTDLPGLAARDGVSFSLYSPKPSGAFSPLVNLLWSAQPIRTHPYSPERPFGNQIYFMLNSFDAIQI